MSRDAPSLPSPLEASSAVSGGRPEEEVDPELVALPAPPRRERTFALFVLAFAGLAALAMAFSLREDVVYALSSATAVSVGNLHDAKDATLLAHENRFVRAEAELSAAGGIGYERPFAADTFRTLPVAGRSDIWVDVRVPRASVPGVWAPPRSLAGRLVRFGAGGPRHRGLGPAIRETAHESVPANAWVLIDGEDPASVHWNLVLAAAFLGFAVWNAAALLRIVRKVR